MGDNSSTSFYHRLPKLPGLPDLPDFSSIHTYNWTLNDWQGIVKTLLVILASFGFFSLLQYAARFYLFGKFSFRRFDYFKFGRKNNSRRGRPIPSSTELEVHPPNKKWRISNEAVSLIHSVLSGLWALYAIVTYTDLMTFMNTFTHPVPKFLIYVSFGYIAHDLIDLLINERSARIMELLFHHVVVIAAFSITLITDMFLGVVVLGLLMEINSIFLHSRSLLNLYRQPKDSTAFKFIALLNIVTFMLFRIAVSIYLLYWQFTNMFTTLVWYHAVITFLVIGSLAVTNSVLLYRVLSADGLLGKHGQNRSRLPTTNDNDNANQAPEELNNEEEIDSDNDGDIEEDASEPIDRRISTAATQTNDEILLNNQMPSIVINT